jgi:hypothetical protein
MRVKSNLRHLLVALSVALLILTTACSSTYERSDAPTGDWSRGILLGESSVKQSVALEVDGEMNVHMAWTEAPSESTRAVRYARLDPQGRVTLLRTLTEDLTYPRQPQLLVDRNGRVHVALLSKSEDAMSIHHTRLDATGNPATFTRLTDGARDVTTFQMFITTEGEANLIWSTDPDDEHAGIYLAALTDSGLEAERIILPEAMDPHVLMAQDPLSGKIASHMVWTYRSGFSAREIHYAELDGAELTPTGGQRLATFEYAESATYQPPVIGIESERVYVLWSVQNLGGGLTPTAADTYYVSFPVGQPELQDPQDIKLPTDHRPQYEDRSASYGYERLAPIPDQVYSTDFINAPAVISSWGDELPAAVSVIIESPSKQFMQLAMVVLEDGEVAGYQLANETSNASVRPTFEADTEGDLHLAWLDAAGFGSYNVYYATTAPAAKEWLDRTTVEDIGTQAADLAWGVLSAIGFLPLTLMWNAPALVSLVLFYLFARQELLDELGAKIALAVSCVVYLGVKTLFLPGLLSAGTPFVYLVSQEFAPVLNTIIPILVLVLALIGLMIYLRWQRSGGPPSLFKAYLVFALIDSVLTAVLYAPRFFNPRG